MQEPRLVALTYAKVPPAVKEEVEEALAGFGFADLPDGYKTVMKCFARAEEVQQAVRRHMGVLADPPRDG